MRPEKLFIRSMGKIILLMLINCKKFKVNLDSNEFKIEEVYEDEVNYDIFYNMTT